MAGRIVYNKIIEWLHLNLSLVLFVFAFFYIISGYIMSKHNWFKSGEEVVNSRVFPLNYIPDTTNINQLGINLKQQFDISGRLDYSRNGKNQIVFQMNRPGVKTKVVVHNNLDSVSITTTTKSSLQEVNTRIHRLHGFKGGFIYSLWAFLVDATAIAMILFSVTGILLWLRMKKMHLPGSIILISTFAFGIAMIMYLK